MTAHAFTESTVEDAALAWLEGAGWQIAHSPDIAPDMLRRGASGLRRGGVDAAPCATRSPGSTRSCPQADATGGLALS